MNENTTMSKSALSEAAMVNAARQTGLALAETPKVRICIPVDRKNPADEVVPVAVNGYLYYIKRGESVQVPKVVADILNEAQYI